MKKIRVWLFKREGEFENLELPINNEKFPYEGLGYQEKFACESISTENTKFPMFTIHGAIEDQSQYPYLLDISLCGRTELICVEDFPALLKLFALLQPLIAFDHDSRLHSEIGDFTRKRSGSHTQ